MYGNVIRQYIFKQSSYLQKKNDRTDGDLNLGPCICIAICCVDHIYVLQLPTAELSLQQTLSDPHNIESQSIAPSICQFMYSAILISLYTLFKYAWVIKQFLLESGKKSIKKKNLRQSEHTECCPDELSIVSFILPGHHHLSNCYRMILLIHKAYMYQY